MSGAAVSKLWLRRGEKVYGPLSGQQLKAMHAQGRLAPTDAIRPDGAITWTPLSQVKGFSSTPAPAPARPDPARFNLGSPKEIYEVVRAETDAVLQLLEQPGGNATLSSAITVARDNFSQLKSRTDLALEELGKSAEWEAFTVAFYGETNAGKSTLIETLRILMGEQSKREHQEKFREILQQSGIDENAIAWWEGKQKEIAVHENDLRSLQLRFSGVLRQQQEHEQALELQSDQLAAEIKALPLWRRLLSFIWKIPLKAVLLAVKAEISESNLQTQRLSTQQEGDEAAIRGRIDAVRAEASRMDATMTALSQYEDGAIIGDGQSDFTRHSTRYEFQVNGSRLVLLDVPGIEGKESLVLEPIMQAVRKAHAVFYVTRKADPPQKGDEKTGSKGTLEKIKEHLGAQTEVWAVFNKSVKSPEQLRGKTRIDELINEGENKGLKVLEKEMENQLGNHYAGLIRVSAYPAFVASASNLLPGRPRSKDRSKFLAGCDADSIRLKTGIQDLVTRFSTEMAENSKLKIRRSNFNKANDAILVLKDSIDSLNTNQFAPLLQKLEDEAQAAALQMDSATDALRSRLESSATELFDRVRNQARQKIYNKIDQDLDNDVFKASLESCIQDHGQMIEATLPESVQKNISQFKGDVHSIVEKFQEHVQGFLDDITQVSTLDIDLNVNIDNGINVAGLVGSVAGGIGLFFITGGWALAIAALGVLVSLYKAVRSFFSSDYKKAQQRNSADENLDRVFGSVKTDYGTQLQEGFRKLEEKMKEVKAGFNLPALQAEQIVASLTDSGHRLALISGKIKKEGGL